MSIAAERAYFDGDHCQHIAAREEVQRLSAKREIARTLLSDPASYRHICNERNARGAAAMAVRIDAAMRTQRPNLKEIG